MYTREAGHERLCSRGECRLPHLFRPSRSSEEGHMCPACIESTVVMVAGAASTGGILAACIGKFREFFKASGLSLFQGRRHQRRPASSVRLPQLPAFSGFFASEAEV